MLLAVTTWVLCYGTYLVLAGALSPTELAAGVPAALIAAVFAAATRRVSDRRLRLDAPWRALRPLASLVPDTVRVGRGLLRAIRRRPPGEMGTTMRQHLSPGGDAAAGDRGLLTLAASLAPNGYVMDVCEGEGRFLLHRLAPVPARQATS